MDLNEARRLALSLAPPGGTEEIRLEAALGRVSSETIKAVCDVPGERRSRLDGYALRSRDSLAASPATPFSLRILPWVGAAGHRCQGRVEEGEGVRILTGAPLPDGTDAVIAQERALIDHDLLVIDRRMEPGDGVTRQGADVEAGDLLIEKGRVLTASRLARLASVGHAFVGVFRKPRVALLATGDEVRELGENADGPSMFCNNRLLLGWMTELQGGEPISLGVARDDPMEIADRLSMNGGADLVVTTGGIGRGDRDFILRAWEILKTSALFRNVDVSPGKSSAMGVREGQTYWALPGNPWAARVVFHELVTPMLWRLQGVKPVGPAAVDAILERPLRKRGGLSRAIPGHLSARNTTLFFVPMERSETSFDSLHKIDLAYTLLEPHQPDLPAGSLVRVKLVDFPLLAAPAFGMEEF